MGVLVKVLYLSTGDVVELGAGLYSTPLLHWICKDMNRKLLTYENDPDYHSYARQYRSRLHSIVLVQNWDKMDTKTRRGVVFVDHSPMNRRAVETIRFKNTAELIVMHDTEDKKEYIDIWPHFKYTYTWIACRPWVSVVSNFTNLDLLKANTRLISPPPMIGRKLAYRGNHEV